MNFCHFPFKGDDMPYLSSRQTSEPVNPLPAKRRYRGQMITIAAMILIVGVTYLGSIVINQT
jgi:hypothetical protein